MYKEIDENNINSMWDLICVGAPKEFAKSVMTSEEYMVFEILWAEFDHKMEGKTPSEIKH